MSWPQPCTPRWRLRVHFPGLFVTFQHCQEHLPQHSVEAQDLYMQFLFSPSPVISFQMRVSRIYLLEWLWRGVILLSAGTFIRWKSPVFFQWSIISLWLEMATWPTQVGRTSLRKSFYSWSCTQQFVSSTLCDDILNFRHMGPAISHVGIRERENLPQIQPKAESPKTESRAAGMSHRRRWDWRSFLVTSSSHVEAGTPELSAARNEVAPGTAPRGARQVAAAPNGRAPTQRPRAAPPPRPGPAGLGSLPVSSSCGWVGPLGQPGFSSSSNSRG